MSGPPREVFDGADKLASMAALEFMGDAKRVAQGLEAMRGEGGSKVRWEWEWRCEGCDAACIPVRTESRCLCGHRMREHAPPGGPDGGRCACKSARCTCKGFFYIVAEGAWVLRCSCKHKHTEHDPVTKKCVKPGCRTCKGFHSPWNCNCGHPWASHRQQQVQRAANPLFSSLMADAISDVNNYDTLRRGQDPSSEGKI